jgi:mannose-6-phosphate isomerase-like protein (cupin superfamily)
MRDTMTTVFVPAGGHRFGAAVSMWGANRFETKVSGADSNEQVFVGEIPDVTGFGPPRHLHHEQDEWFYVTKGSFAIEVGGKLYEAKVGDSLLAPRKVVHTWAPLGPEPCSMIFVLQPAGDFDGFVDDASGMGRLPTPDEANAIFEAHGMQIAGPPLDAATISFTG